MKRNTKQIWEQILYLCQEPTGITRVVYQCNLNFRSATGYLSELMDKSYLTKYEKLYLTTAEGHKALAILQAADAL